MLRIPRLRQPNSVTCLFGALWCNWSGRHGHRSVPAVGIEAGSLPPPLGAKHEPSQSSAYSVRSPSALPAWSVESGKPGSRKLSSGRKVPRKHIVFVTGDDELFRGGWGGRASAERHGRGAVLFVRETGAIDPAPRTTSGPEELGTPMMMTHRFRKLRRADGARRLPESGRPVVGLRHPPSLHRPESLREKLRQQGAWLRGGWAWGDVDCPRATTAQSTRGLFAPGAAGYPILRGISDATFGPTDVMPSGCPGGSRRSSWARWSPA